MTVDKMSMQDSGLSGLEFDLVKIYQVQAFAQKTINSGNENLFYTIVLFNKENEGVVRAGFKLSNEKLIYNVNELEISSEQVNFKNLKIQK